MRLLLPLTCALLLALPASGFAIPLDPPTVRPEPVVHPVDGPVGYGEWGARYGNFRNGHVHAGQDVFAPAGTPLLAIRDSLVLETGNDGGRGNYVALYSRAERETYVYFHMLAPTPRAAGDRVRAGERVGRVGCTGSCWGDHLHFEIRDGRGVTGESRDPLPLLRRLGR
jgi:murein DD-endopeptidase MepM/ murein hydrolase activator NlpD